MTARDYITKKYGEPPTEGSVELAYPELFDDMESFAHECCKEQREACVEYYSSRCEKGSYSEWNHEVLNNTPLVV